MKKNKSILKQILFILAIVGGILFVSYSFGILGNNEMEKESSDDSLKYNLFREKVKDSEIDTVEFKSNKSKLKVTTQSEEVFFVSDPDFPEFRKFLLENGVEVSELPTPFHMNAIRFLLEILFVIIPIGILLLFLRGYMPKNKNTKENIVITSNVKFSDVAGHEETKTDLVLLVDFLKNPKKYQQLGAKLPKGVILHGPPGTGKTLFAKAIAGEADVPFFNVNASEFVEMYVGVGASRVRQLFKDARQKAPCVIFVDELEALAKKAGIDNNSEKEQTLKQFLVELDGFNESSGILVIGATNNLNALDETFTRSGRFDRHITIGLPDINDRKKIIEYYSKNKKLAKEIDFESLAKYTSTCSGADIAKIINEAAISASVKRKKAIDNEDLDEAFYKAVMKGYQRKNLDRDPIEVKTVGYHEAGHAIIAKFLANKNVPKVSIIASTSGAGGVTFINNEKEHLLSKEDIKNDIMIAYGGRAAEFILFNDENKITTGASSDIGMATQKLHTMVKVFGMSNFGMINLDVIDIKSEKVLEEIKVMSQTLYKETLEYLEKNKNALEKISKALIEKETLTEEELVKMWNNSKASKDINGKAS